MGQVPKLDTLLRASTLVQWSCSLLLCGTALLLPCCCVLPRKPQMTREELAAHGLSMSPEQRLALGVRLEQLGKYKEAEAHYVEVLRGGSHKEEAYTNLGNVYSSIADRSFRPKKWSKKAVESYRRALEINPNSPATRNNLGDVLNKLGRHREALTLVSELAKPGLPDARYFLCTLGDAQMGVHHYEDAMRSYAAAEKEAARQGDATPAFLRPLYEAMARVSRKLGQTATAREYEQKAKALLW